MPVKSEILQFVEKQFESSKEPVSGIHIKMADGTMCNVILIEENNVVRVYMNHQDMGRFEKYDGQGYQYAFYQANRVGMKKNGYTINERMMMSICENHNLIRLFKA